MPSHLVLIDVWVRRRVWVGRHWFHCVARLKGVLRHTLKLLNFVDRGGGCKELELDEQSREMQLRSLGIPMTVKYSDLE